MVSQTKTHILWVQICFIQWHKKGTFSITYSPLMPPVATLMTTTGALDTHLKKAFRLNERGIPESSNYIAANHNALIYHMHKFQGKWKIIMNSIHENKSHMPISSSSTKMAVNNLSKSKADFEEFTSEKVRKVEETNNKYLAQHGIVLNVIFRYKVAMNWSLRARKTAWATIKSPDFCQSHAASLLRERESSYWMINVENTHFGPTL